MKHFSVLGLILTLYLITLPLCEVHGAKMPGYKTINQLTQTPPSKYNQRQPLAPDTHAVGMDATEFSKDRPANKCYHDMDILWHRKLDTAIFGTPLITDMFADGHKEVIIPGLSFLHSLSGDDGTMIVGTWPVGLEEDEFIASPLEYDVEGDGVEEILMATRNGRIIFVSEEGYVDMNRMLQVPPTYIERHWYSNKKTPANLKNVTSYEKEKKVDLEGFYDLKPDENNEKVDKPLHTSNEPAQTPPRRKSKQRQEELDKKEKQKQKDNYEEKERDKKDKEKEKKERRKQEEEEEMKHGTMDDEYKDYDKKKKSSSSKGKRALLEIEEDDDKYKHYDNIENYKPVDKPQAADEEEIAVDEEIIHRMTKDEIYKLFGEKLTMDGKTSLELFLPAQAEIRKDILDWSWAVNYEKWMTNHAPPKNKKKFIEVPPHILAAPVIADLENDGEYELVVPVSYYYEHWLSLYDNLKKEESKKGVDLSKYIACGIVVFNLKTLDVKWNILLDLTTDSESTFKGTIYSPPTVVDLDADGELEIIVATTSGFIYVLNSKGVWEAGMSQMVMDSIYGGVTVEDVTGDGNLDIIAADSVGNVVCFNNKGEEIWENQIVGEVYHNPVVGDVNGDGILDVVIATTGNAIYALRGDDGRFLAYFPVRLAGPVLSQPILFHMAPADKHLHVIVNDYAGHLYVIDSLDGCVERMDLGGQIVSSVVSDDINNNGRMDIIVCTTDGDVYALATEAPYNALESWPSYFRNRNSVSMTNKLGIRVAESTKRTDSVTGQQFRVNFEIFDKREKVSHDRLYTVKILAGSDILFNQTFRNTGSYSVVSRVPDRITASVVKVRMTNEHGQTFYDSFDTSFNAKFYRSIKWILVLPLLAMCGILLCLKEIRDFQLLPQ